MEALELETSELAVIASLLLRGPETPGELRGRAARMHPFASLEEVDAVLQQLIDKDPPLVRVLPRQPGQKESRYAQLLAESQSVAPEEETGAAAASTEMEERLAALEARVEELAASFAAFRRQFE